MTTEKLLETIKSVKPGRHSCSLKDITIICDAAGGGPLQTGADCFRLGFAQGQKAARAEMRREKRKFIEQDASAWGGFLSRWLERNIHDERILGLVGTFARTLESRKDTKKAKEEELVRHG